MEHRGQAQRILAAVDRASGSPQLRPEREFAGAAGATPAPAPPPTTPLLPAGSSEGIDRRRCWRCASRRRNTRQRSSGIHTALTSLSTTALPQQARERPRVELVGLWPARDAGVTRATTITRSTCGSRIRATSRQLRRTSTPSLTATAPCLTLTGERTSGKPTVQYELDRSIQASRVCRPHDKPGPKPVTENALPVYLSPERRALSRITGP
jgi:hypothetical protein